MSWRIRQRKRRTETEPAVTITIHQTGLVSAFIPGDQELNKQLAADEKAWWDSLTDQERAEHLAWEEAETARWLAWAKERQS